MQNSLSWIAALSLSLSLSSCTTDLAQRAPSEAPSNYGEPIFDLPLKTELGEHLVAGEQEAVNLLFQLMRKHMEKHYSPPSVHAFRAVHAKGHGCVKATFEVLDNIDPALKVGVFAKAGSLDAVIRFSNGDGPPENDDELNSRGMAIKLLNIPGAKILEENDPLSSQDFLMADQPAFFLKDVVDYSKAIQAKDGGLFRKVVFKAHFDQQLKFRDSATPIKNPLNAQYWSKTPYQLGENEVIKFTSHPCVFPPMDPPPRDQKNYMQQEMKDEIDRGDVCFEFLVQKRIHTADQDTLMPIEDASKIWSEDLSAFQKVAVIHIPGQQDFTSPENQEKCENLSFNPWHSLVVHRPLGNLNRVRKIVYKESSGWRHQHNDVPQ